MIITVESRSLTSICSRINRTSDTVTAFDNRKPTSWPDRWTDWRTWRWANRQTSQRTTGCSRHMDRQTTDRRDIIIIGYREKMEKTLWSAIMSCWPHSVRLVSLIRGWRRLLKTTLCDIIVKTMNSRLTIMQKRSTFNRVAFDQNLLPTENGAIREYNYSSASNYFYILGQPVVWLLWDSTSKPLNPRNFISSVSYLTILGILLFNIRHRKYAIGTSFLYKFCYTDIFGKLVYF